MDLHRCSCIFLDLPRYRCTGRWPTFLVIRHPLLVLPAIAIADAPAEVVLHSSCLDFRYLITWIINCKAPSTSFNAFNGDRSPSVKPCRLHSLVPLCSIEVWNSVLLKLHSTGKYVSFPCVWNFCSLERTLDGRQWPHPLVLC